MLIFRDVTAQRRIERDTGEPAADRSPARVDHRIVRRRHHQQVARRHHSELECRGRAAVRLHRRAGHRPPHLSRSFLRIASPKKTTSSRSLKAGQADRPFRNRARALRRPAHPAFAHDLADQGRRRHGDRRVQDRARRDAPAAGRAARTAAAGGSGRGEREVPRVLRAGRAVCRDHGRERHAPRGQPPLLGGLRLHAGSKSSASRSGRARGGRRRQPLVEQITGGLARRPRPGRRSARRCRTSSRTAASVSPTSRSSRSGTTPGRVLFLAPTGVDITDRKRAEADREKFVTLVESSTDFIGMCDLNGVPVLRQPRRPARWSASTASTQARRTPVRDRSSFPKISRGSSRSSFPPVLETGHGEIEVRFRHFKTGEARWMAYKVLTLPDAARTADRVRDRQPGCHRAQAAGRQPAAAGGGSVGGRPPQERVPGDAGARAAQSAGADQQRRAGAAAGRRRRRRRCARRPRCWSVRSARWRGWSTTCST